MSRDPFGLSGQLIDGQFRVERPVGEGGFSVVYRGMHAGMGEPIAVKCLKLTATLDGESIESFTRRFRDEGRLLYRLGQGNLDIVRCIMSGTTVAPASGALVPYMVLEWLDGLSLAAELRIRRDQQLRGRSLEEMTALFEPGVLALEYAHQQGVVHRDVKPGNLFLAGPSGRTRMKVLDFGLAKVLDETIGIIQKATVGSFMMCSPRYAAPEQFDPKIGPIGPWTDVYSLALVILEVLRDRKVRPNEGLMACMIQAIDPKADLSAKALGMQLPPGIEAALARAVTLDPRGRQRSAGELWNEIKSAMRTRASSPWGAQPQEGEPATRSPASLAPDTLVDPVFSVPMPSGDVGAATLMMLDAPPRPGPHDSTPPPRPRPYDSTPAPRPARGPSVPPPLPGPGPSIPPPLPAPSYAPYAAMPSAPPARPHSGPLPVRRRSRAPWVVLLVLVLAGLGTAGFLGWRARRLHRGAAGLPQSSFDPGLRAPQFEPGSRAPQAVA